MTSCLKRTHSLKSPETPRPPKRFKTHSGSKTEAMEAVVPAAEDGHQDRDSDDNRTELASLTELTHGSWFLQTTSKLIDANKSLFKNTQSKTAVPVDTQTIRIQLPQSFTLQPMFITNGEYKDCHAILLKPVKEHKPTTLGLMDLPPEIRNNIWKFHFGRPATLRIGSWKSAPPVSKKYARVVGIKRDGVDESWQEYEERLRPGKWLDRITILAVCRSISNETAPMWYGSNTFLIDQMADLELFLRSVGSMEKLIRSIEMSSSFYNNSRLPARLLELDGMERLSRLTLPHRLLHWGGSAYRGGYPLEGLVKGLVPVLKHVKKVNRLNKRDKSLLDIIVFSGNTECGFITSSARQAFRTALASLGEDGRLDRYSGPLSLTKFKKSIHPCKAEAELLRLLKEALRN